MVPVPLAAPFLTMSDGFDPDAQAVHSLYPSHDPQFAKQIVGASHSDLTKVRELLALSPALAKAAWDWGFGDWETALGAASHTGNREIAELLISFGAKPDIYTWAMLGNLAAVKAMIESTPGLQKAHGPHGITLLAHARSGGEPAKPVLDYLAALGDSDVPEKDLPLEDSTKQAYLGFYQLGQTPDDSLVVSLNKQGRLQIKRGAGSERLLLRVEDHGFAPKGCPFVRIRFAVLDSQAASLSVHDLGTVLTAARAASL